MALAAGTALGAYEIIALLGAGGMGEVYRARDTKLGRDVALKTLPESVTHDSERLARFRREAQLLAALNHPHIGAIYGLEETNSQRFLVLELVEGETLAARIQRGPLPVAEALAIAREIAAALEAAHEKGIIHRDLKPANIALTTRDRVKVLDFGLAKAADIARAGSSADAVNSPTVTSPATLTRMGLILGPAAYMSPEQARGRAADKRSDVWAFGCVLYEMLTGKRAFEGDDVSDALASVLKSDPAWSALPPSLSPATRALLEGCLEKDHRERISDPATRFFAGEDPIGRRISLGDMTAEIVGVVGNIRRASLTDEPRADLYFPFERVMSPSTTLFIRATGDPIAVLPAVRAAVHRLEPHAVLYEIRTLSHIAEKSAAAIGLAMRLLLCFASIALLLAAVGVYGMMAYRVRRRMRELATRLALGASPGDIIWLVMRQAGTIMAVGLAVGLTAAVVLARTLSSLLFDVPPWDPAALASAIALLAAATLAASYLPARRAARVDPVSILAAE